MLNRIKSFFCILLVLGLSVLFPINHSFSAYGQIDTESSFLSISEQADGNEAYQYLQKLCSKEFEGRQTGTKGGDIASAWIGELFQGFGLKPAYPNGNLFFQNYKAPCFNLLPEVSFMLTTKAGDFPFVYKQDFVPCPGSGSGTASGAIVFVGYGVTNLDKNYDDYAGIDVKNKIALILRKEPATFNFTENDKYFSTKISNAKKHGATGVILIEKAGEINPYSMRTKAVTGSLGSDFPAVFIPTVIGDQILSESNTTVLDLQMKIDNTHLPQSMSIKAGAYIKVTMSMEMKDTRNVIGYIPANDPTIDTNILITAHYDHLGIDLVNGDLYPGANDNGSGSATLIEIAHVLTSNCFIPDINVVFIAFSGEEEGLLGSSYYIENPLFPLDKTVAVLNMDMVGTGKGTINAGTSYKELTEKIVEAAKELKRNVSISKSLMLGGSDQLLFAQKNIPAVFFIRSNPTGLGDYHSPLDTVDTVDPKNLEEQAQLLIIIVSAYSNPKILIFDTKTDYWFHETAVHGRIMIQGKGSPGITGNIQNQTFTVPENGILQKIVQLNEGQNLIQIQILNQKGETILERMISITAKINQELNGDFNFDKEINFSDLLLFAKIYPSNLIKTALEELCDLNYDQRIDENDFIILKKSYDYRLEK
jgi:hypothetical protein